jgi:pyridoxal/pyridoxine/pyridoxamine kinase
MISTTPIITLVQYIKNNKKKITILGCLNKTKASNPNIFIKEDPLLALAGLQEGMVIE